MSFYSSISAFYDEIFPVDADEMAFVKSRLEGRKAVLDIGCGTGNKTVFLAEAGRKIIAIDGDMGMIGAARREHAAPGLKYRVLNMTEIKNAFEPESFDAVLCLGNTLVHLPNADEIAQLLAQMASILKPGGLAIIQILNYERILDDPAFALPVLETDKIRFVRKYQFKACEMRFVTSLLLKESGQEIQNDIPLYPLRKNELDIMLADAGYLEAAHYGSYQGTPLQENSLPLIAVAVKG